MSGMRKEYAQQWLNGIDATLLIVGFKSDGYRGIPATFKEHIATAKNETELLQLIGGFENFRVFSIKEDEASSDWWKNRSENLKNQMTESEERELFEKLKEKYDPK